MVADAATQQEAVRLRRETVLKAARQVFEAKGLEDASIRLIADAAGMTTGAIYPYFSGKEEIYAELLSQSLETLREELKVAAHGSGEVRFRVVLSAFFAFYEERPTDLSLALYLFRGLKPQGLTLELNSRLNGKAREVLAVVRDAVAAMPNRGREPELEVALQVTFLFGLLTMYHTRRARMLGVPMRTLLAAHLDDAAERLARG